jgi:hypothetical protein
MKLTRCVSEAQSFMLPRLRVGLVLVPSIIGTKRFAKREEGGFIIRGGVQNSKNRRL